MTITEYLGEVYMNALHDNNKLKQTIYDRDQLIGRLSGQLDEVEKKNKEFIEELANAGELIRTYEARLKLAEELSENRRQLNGVHQARNKELMERNLVLQEQVNGLLRMTDEIEKILSGETEYSWNDE